MYDEQESEVIPEIVGTLYAGDEPSERNLWTPSLIYYIFWLIVENDINAAGTAALTESADIGTVSGVELEEDKNK